MDCIQHYGIRGMKWGVRRYQNEDGTLTAAGKKRAQKPEYRSKGIRARMARRSNAKVDKGFNDWKKNAELKKNAIDLGKKANADRLAMEKNHGDRQLKRNYRASNRAYRKALKQNTTYRKGSIRQEVGRDMSRKYMTEANRIAKQMQSDPSNRQLKRDYNRMMSQHDIERARARKAQSVGESRSRKIASAKSVLTKTIKSVALTTAVGIGTRVVADAAGLDLDISAESVQDWIRKGRKAYSFLY